MPYLVVCGVSTWGAYKNARCLKRFEPGVYEVSDEIAALAKEPGTPARVVVCDQRPDIISGHDGAPLTLEDIRVGVQSGVRFPSPPPEPETDEGPVERPSVPDAYFCEFCPAAFPSEPPLRRHVKVEHMLHHEPEEQEEQAVEQQAVTDVDDRLAKARPDELHPAERELLEGWPA